MKNLIVALLLITFNTTAVYSASDSGQRGMDLFEDIPIDDLQYLFDSGNSLEELGGHCRDLDIDQDTRHGVYVELINLIKSTIDHKAEMKKSKIDYMVAAIHQSTTRDQANEISQQMRNHLFGTINSWSSFIDKTLFETLNGQQRVALLKCLKHMRHSRGHHPRNGSGK